MNDIDFLYEKEFTPTAFKLSLAIVIISSIPRIIGLILLSQVIFCSNNEPTESDLDQLAAGYLLAE